jgi:hypothetical protein
MSVELVDQHNIVEELIRTYGGGKGEPIKDVLGIAVHHEAGSENGSSVYGIARYHIKDQGWSHIGYTWVIERNGTLYQTLDLTTAPYHAGAVKGDTLAMFPNKDPQYYNEHFWAVCLVGNLDIKPPTDAQFDTLANLCAALKRGMPPGFKIFGHGELPGKGTACPGKHMQMSWLRKEAERRMVEGNTGSAETGPGPGDDPFFRQFTTWRDAAINAKGVADDALNRMAAFGTIINASILRQEETLRELRALREDVRAVTGK